MKSFPYILFAFLAISCNNQKVVDENATDTLTIISDTITDLPIVESDLVEIEEEDFKNEFDILISGNYRDFNNENPTKAINENWLSLYEKNGEYFLEKAKFTIERDFSECSGDSTKIISSKNKTLLFLDEPNLKLGKINSIKIKKNKIWPNEKISFKFNNIDYFLRAEGDVLSSEKVHTDNGLEIYQQVENYKLFISAKNTTESQFLKEKSFNDTFTELLFVGDIDSDGKLDFIFKSNRHYEEERIILFLSSKAEKGKIIKKVAEITIQFDC